MAEYTMGMHPRAAQYDESLLPGMIPNEAELTAGVRVEPGRAYGFFTDTSLCIGCKSCEVACKEWNLLPADPGAGYVRGETSAAGADDSSGGRGTRAVSLKPVQTTSALQGSRSWAGGNGDRRGSALAPGLALSGMSYDNTRRLTATTWRHVAFIERLRPDTAAAYPTFMPPFQSHWLMMSDVCKHCDRAGCLDACPTGALFRTEFDTVVVQQDICNGCGYCVPSCPFGVVALSDHDGRAHKCTLCYDRLKAGLEPACAKACPTNSIQFGELSALRERAELRVAQLHAQKVANAYLYGVPGSPGATGGIGGLHCFFLLLDRPELYNLPLAPVVPSVRVGHGILRGILAMAGLGLAAAITFAFGPEQKG